jgi:hypothetical protein
LLASDPRHVKQNRSPPPRRSPLVSRAPLFLLMDPIADAGEPRTA